MHDPLFCVESDGYTFSITSLNIPITIFNGSGKVITLAKPFNILIGLILIQQELYWKAKYQ